MAPMIRTFDNDTTYSNYWCGMDENVSIFLVYQETIHTYLKKSLLRRRACVYTSSLSSILGLEGLFHPSSLTRVVSWFAFLSPFSLSMKMAATKANQKTTRARNAR